MRKVLIIILVLIVAIIFWPKKISNGAGMPFSGQVVHYQKCHGLYIKKYDMRGTDGPTGGYCFGLVQKGVMRVK